MKELWLEDLESILPEIADQLCSRWDINDQEQGELVFEALWFALEKFTTGEYRNHN